MKKIVHYLTQGATIGIAVGFLISLVFSFIYQSKDYAPSAPIFMAHFSSSTIATAVSGLLWALIGCVFGVSSLVFEQDQWSITKQTVVHFLITYIGFTPLAILCGWFPLNFFWLLFFTITFIIIYVIIWAISMISARREIQAFNAKLHE
ncbi:MAG TPA: DUF3021 domain-containing protein [Lactobacillus sp.]|nr:DUF3021 domain-containing protein [Lactobacillus sp.]